MLELYFSVLEKTCLETPLQNKVAGWALNSELLTVKYSCI